METYKNAAENHSAVKELQQLIAKKHGDVLHPLRIKALLSLIAVADYPLLNLDAASGGPDLLVFTHLLVPPNCIRPSIAMDSSRSNEDDLTMKLSEIISMNKNLEKELINGGDLGQLLLSWDFLQLVVGQYINSELGPMPLQLQTKKQMRGYCQRLKGKGGRFRGNLSGMYLRIEKK